VLQENALCDLTTARNWLGNTDSAFEDFLELAINTLSGTFDALVGYRIIEKNYTGIVLSGSGERLLRFPANQVTACSQIEYRSSHTLWKVLPTHLYELDAINKRGVLGYAGFSFSAGIQNWRADFTAGWPQTDIPGTVKEAFMYEVKRFVERRPDIISENMGGQSASGRNYAVLRDSTRKALAPYMLQSF
jgi:hypothetical protein